MTYQLTPDQVLLRNRDPEAFALGANAERERVYNHLRLCAFTGESPVGLIANGVSVIDRLPSYRHVAAENGNLSGLEKLLAELDIVEAAKLPNGAVDHDAEADRLIAKINTARSLPVGADIGDQVVARLAAQGMGKRPHATPTTPGSTAGKDLGDQVVERLQRMGAR